MFGDPASASGGWICCTDLRVGEYVHVFGRELLLTDCDGYTRAFYAQELNMEQPTALLGSGGDKKGQSGAPQGGGAGAALGFGGQYGIGIGSSGRVNTKSQARMQAWSGKDTAPPERFLGTFPVF